MMAADDGLSGAGVVECPNCEKLTQGQIVLARILNGVGEALEAAGVDDFDDSAAACIYFLTDQRDHLATATRALVEKLEHIDSTRRSGRLGIEEIADELAAVRKALGDE